MTPTQFAARALGLLPFLPPGCWQPARSVTCWLCGGQAGDKPWPQPVAIAPTFTQHNTARASDSDAVCQSCAALTRAASFQAMVAARALPIKTWTQAGWHSYSHHIREDGHYEAPGPERQREIALGPPEGRWMLCLNTTGKKHTIFRGVVATSRDRFPVQMDETTVWCKRDTLTACLADFEALCALGFAKDGILAGVYHPAQLLKVGLARWSPAEERMVPWRADHPDLLTLVHAIARGPRHFPEVKPAVYRPIPAIAAADAAPMQGSLF